MRSPFNPLMKGLLIFLTPVCLMTPGQCECGPVLDFNQALSCQLSQISVPQQDLINVKGLNSFLADKIILEGVLRRFQFSDSLSGFGLPNAAPR